MTVINGRIIDNHKHKVVDYLRDKLKDKAFFRLVSAYFSIYGYDLLEDELQRVDKVNFLFGQPSSVGNLVPGEKEEKSFVINDGGLVLKNQLEQKAVAKRCEEWVLSENVNIRSIKEANFLHGKMYHIHEGGIQSAVVGSSNFTKKGLGGSKNSNLEINLAVEDNITLEELREWFDELWNNEERTEDVQEKVLEALRQISKDYDPETVYYKTLYELFKDELYARRERDDIIEASKLQDTKIWKKLYQFQRDGVKTIINRIENHKGCILADSVGLGKTYTALAVIKYFELRNDRILVLCPKKLRKNWALYPVYNNNDKNPFSDDRFCYSLLSHTDLSYENGERDGIELQNFKWSNIDLIVIDESHNFRNSSSSLRYKKLYNDVIREGVNTKVLMLSATPVNTSLNNLYSQIKLIIGEDEAAFSELGVSHVQDVIKEAQKKFKDWADDLLEKKKANPNQDIPRDKSKLLDQLGPDFLRLLGATSIARSRAHIEKDYTDDLKLIGAFPVREKAENLYPGTDTERKISYEEIADEIDKLNMAIYTPFMYFTEKRKKELEKSKDKMRLSQQSSEKALSGMIRTLFLKRLESSAKSFVETLSRTSGKIEGKLDEINTYKVKIDKIIELKLDAIDVNDDDEFFASSQKRLTYTLSELDLEKWAEALEKDKVILKKLYTQLEKIIPYRDAKLAALVKEIKKRSVNPTKNKNGKTCRKLLIFTSFKDTAKYLYSNLEPIADNLEMNMAMVSGDESICRVNKENISNDFDTILTDFAPQAKERNDQSVATEIELLIATDCISEGQNLQDCDVIINYDIHWNPVRLIQRFGRIDRLGSKFSSVRMINFWPTEDLDNYLNLRTSVASRMALSDTTGPGGDDMLDDSSSTFDRSLLDDLRNRVVNPDRTDDIVMSDLTLDDFIDQILSYLRKNKEILEKIPLGVYAVTDECPLDIPSGTGAIFVLRLLNPNNEDSLSERDSYRASPLHPYYMVYIRDDGNILIQSIHLKKCLKLFETLALGRTAPLKQLCKQFDKYTNNGKDMTHYEELLLKSISDIDKEQNKKNNHAVSTNRKGSWGKSKKGSDNVDNFKLITWLVITE